MREQGAQGKIGHRLEEGKALTELKLQLAMKGVTKFTYKVKKDGETILITPKYKEK